MNATWMLASAVTPAGAWQTFCLTLLAVLGVGFLLAFIRLARGPTLTDRVIALDVLAANGVAAAALYGMTYGLDVLLDVALALAVVSFVATVAFARYVERTARA
jgi:multicomponent Na+:H+ antiporter subunit F